uniref:Bifunctional inhibitor/plant lipid transfer protein/seed storage helical domain-containing protein n=1 Tax=Brassica oleracea var. oleracea TaxID=109376 RepID=A0A0D3BVU4_BRAOL
MTRFLTGNMIFAAAMTAMLLVTLPEVEAQAPTTCVSKLVPCFSALKTTTKPPKDCCDSIKEAVEKELTRIAPIRHLLSVLSSSVQDGVDVRSRPPVLVPLRRVSSTSASPHLKPMTAPSRVVLSTFAVVGIKPHCRVSDPLLPVCHCQSSVAAVESEKMFFCHQCNQTITISITSTADPFYPLATSRLPFIPVMDFTNLDHEPDAFDPLLELRRQKLLYLLQQVLWMKILWMRSHVQGFVDEDKIHQETEIKEMTPELGIFAGYRVSTVILSLVSTIFL